MSDLLDDTFFLPAQTEIDRAVNYPYDAPDTAFVFENGRLRSLDDAAILFDRTAVLSVGSNRAPVQLRRKFGDDAIIPVTPAILHDCDIVHAAQLGYYGAVPCTAFPAAGCEVLPGCRLWSLTVDAATNHRAAALASRKVPAKKNGRGAASRGA